MKIAKEEAAAGIASKDNDYVSVGQQIELEEEERHPVGIQKYAGDEFVDETGNNIMYIIILGQIIPPKDNI